MLVNESSTAFGLTTKTTAFAKSFTIAIAAISLKNHFIRSHSPTYKLKTLYSISIIALPNFCPIFLKNVNFFISSKSKQSQNFVKNIVVKLGQDNVYQIIEIGYKAFKMAYKSTSTWGH